MIEPTLPCDVAMGPIDLFDLASQHAHWLTARQAAIAPNVANVNAPGLAAGDVVPFDEVVDDASIRMAATSPGAHRDRSLGAGPGRAEGPSAWETMQSGNSVSLENEMIKAGEVNRSCVKR
jgi:flagellar basal-body rod protein FlgB